MAAVAAGRCCEGSELSVISMGKVASAKAILQLFMSPACHITRGIYVSVTTSSVV